MCKCISKNSNHMKKTLTKELESVVGTLLLMVVMMTAHTTWAQTPVSLSMDNDYSSNQAGFYYVNKPAYDVTVSLDPNELQWSSGNTICRLGNDGTFTVSPVAGTNGAMANYSPSESAPWHSKIDNVKQLFFEPGVTEIGAYTFANLGALEVNLPDGMKKIHAYAFQYAHITKVTIPSTMTNVAKGAFYCCDYLNDVYCHAQAENLTWKGTLWDFKHHPDDYIYATKMHVQSCQLQAFQSKFGEKLNVTIVGDIVPTGNWMDAENRSTTFREKGNIIYIDNEADLALLAYNLNTGATEYWGFTFQLTRDLDMSAHYWTPIGTIDNPFSSKFDGGGHTISGIIVNRPNADFNGLFGYGKGCEIRDLVLKNSSISGRDFTGGVIGSIYPQQISNLFNVVSHATVSGANRVGGVAGEVAYKENNVAYVTNCLYLGNSVTATGNEKGAVIGRITSSYEHENTYYTDEAVSGLSSSDVRAYEMKPKSLPKGVNVSYSGTQGVEHHGSFYAPKGATFTINVSAVEPLVQTIEHVYVDGKEITASSNGAYPYTLSEATNHTLTVATTQTDITGNGTEANPYLITTANQWDAFANAVNNGATFTGKFIKLGADISVNTMAGVKTKGQIQSFDGTFDGDNHTLTVSYGTDAEPFDQAYCAPFRYVYDATFRNLHVDGNIYTANQHAAGIAGWSSGILIEGCRSSVAIHSTVNGEGGHGGFVGNPSKRLTIRDSWFDGSLLGEKTNGCGGFVGWTNDEVSFENCLLNPTAVTISGENSKTFACYLYDRNLHIDCNCYYVTPIGTEQGKQAYSENPGDDGYAIVTAADGNTYYTFSPVFWSQEEYRDQTWGADYSATEFTISTAEQLAQFAYLVNAGKDFKDKTIILTDNIDLGDHFWKAIGTHSDNGRRFRGTFDGAGYVIDNVYAIEDPTDTNWQAIGLFGGIENANLRNIVLTNIIAVNGPRSDVGGLVARAYADEGYHDVYTIKNCHVFSGAISLLKVDGNIIESTGAIAGLSNVDIEACSVGADVTVTSVDHAGGIVGDDAYLFITVKGCISAASVSAGKIAGGIISNRENCTVMDCLYIGSSINGNWNKGAIVGKVAKDDEFSNNYFIDSQFAGNEYTLTEGVSLGYTYTVEPEGLGEMCAAYDSGITAYDHGLLFSSLYIMATPPPVINLIDVADNSAVISEHAGKEVKAILAGRTLYKDGSWNTLCLPFDVEDFISTPLEGAKVMTLEGTSYSQGTLTIDFVETTSIEAGYPYLIKWRKADDYVNDHQHNLHEPVFENVIISKTSPDACTFGTDVITFKGLYAPLSIGENGDETLLYLGDDNALHYSQNAMDINAFHAYFTATVSYGDVNGDGYVNVTDVTILVNHILGKETEGFVINHADVNGDGDINVTDVTALVNLILHGTNILNVEITGADGITFSGGDSVPARISRK